MKKYITLFILLLGAVISADAQNNFIGDWATDDRNTVIEIYTEEAAYYAKIITSQNREIANKIVMIQMIAKSETQLYGGTYYDEQLKSEFEARLKLTDKNTMRLKILNGLFNKTIIWHRVREDWEQKVNAITVLQP